MSDDAGADRSAGEGTDAPDAPDESMDAVEGGTEDVDGSQAADEPGGDEPEVPDWEDEYLDRVSGSLLYSFDLEKHRRVEGETFPMYGRLEMTSQKHFLHPALSYAHHESREHLFVSRVDRVRVADLERYVQLGHDLADEWIEADEEHYSTEFTFVIVTEEIPDDVRRFVDGFQDRTMLKYGYYGHYEVNLAVVAPEAETVVASDSADVARAFALWESPEEESTGLLGRLLP